MFSHEALLYEGPDGLLAGTLPFIREGLERDEPVLVAVGADKIERLRGALGAERVEFADMAVLGHNPARIIPAWHDFLAATAARVRGIGEPIWAGRSAAELVECQLHEALLNVAFAESRGFRAAVPLRRRRRSTRASCTRRAAAIRRQRRSRATPSATPSGCWRRSSRRCRRRPRSARLLGFELDTVGDVRRLTRAVRGGARARPREDLVLAVDELAANSIRHGGGRGILRIWRDGGTLVCEVRDRGRIGDPLAGRHVPEPSSSAAAASGSPTGSATSSRSARARQGTAVRLHMSVKPKIS